jgi:hypothetical protein
MRAALPLLLIGAGLAGCARAPSPVITIPIVTAPPVVGTPLAWRAVANPSDANRIASLAGRYAAAFGGKGPENLRADARKGWPEPTPGVYDCRITRLGVGQTVARATAFKPFICYVGDDDHFLTLTKGTGSERPGGRLWRDEGQRMVFLGAVPAAGSDTPNAYGDDAATDRVGIFERIGDFRWRLILDAPRPGIAFDVLEMTPVPQPVVAAAR